VKLEYREPPVFGVRLAFRVLLDSMAQPAFKVRPVSRAKPEPRVKLESLVKLVFKAKPAFADTLVFKASRVSSAKLV
jgi:hypothetical protein